MGVAVVNYNGQKNQVQCKRCRMHDKKKKSSMLIFNLISGNPV